ncbi:UNVERIFIED_CONTAM: hypothetical protein FKN15_026702 [Acipenser sinensis]
MLDVSTLGARRFGARCTHPRCRRSVLGAQPSVFSAWCTHPRHSVLIASTLGARASTFDALCSTFGALQCSVSQHVWVPPLHHMPSCRRTNPTRTAWLAWDQSTLRLPWRTGHSALCAAICSRTLFARWRKAVGDHSPSSGLSHTLSALLWLSRRTSSQLTAGQRSPGSGCAQQPHSPSIQPRDPSPYRGCSRRTSRSRSRSPRRRGCFRSPHRERHHRDRSGVLELTSKKSQFMEVMLGQQTLLMSLANRVPRAMDDLVGPVANKPTVPPQPLSAQVFQQPQEVWDADVISRDASEVDPLLEEDSVETELVSHHSEQESSGASNSPSGDPVASCRATSAFSF